MYLYLYLRGTPAIQAVSPYCDSVCQLLVSRCHPPANKNRYSYARTPPNAIRPSAPSHTSPGNFSPSIPTPFFFNCRYPKSGKSSPGVTKSANQAPAKKITQAHFPFCSVAGDCLGALLNCASSIPSRQHLAVPFLISLFHTNHPTSHAACLLFCRPTESSCFNTRDSSAIPLFRLQYPFKLFSLTNSPQWVLIRTFLSVCCRLSSRAQALDHDAKLLDVFS